MATILIADDDTSYADVLSAAVTAQGHTVVRADNGLEACEMAEQSSPDVILLSPTLPVFDGFETCRQLRDNPGVTSRIPILLLASGVPDKVKLESSGFTDYLLKQCSSSELNELLVRHLRDSGGAAGF